jgi:ribosomal protein S18 acetylase RimI-like enzyme
MTVTLRPFSTIDLKQHIAWAEAIEARHFMSRIFPKGFEGSLDDNSPNFRWYVIIYNDTDIGSVWLEKQNSDEDITNLGIFLGNKDLLGKGIGRKAIEQAVLESMPTMRAAKVRLNVRKNNKRAQSCYKACGFKIVSQDIKTNDDGERIEFYTMEKEIPNNLLQVTA